MNIFLFNSSNRDLSEVQLSKLRCAVKKGIVECRRSVGLMSSLLFLFFFVFFCFFCCCFFSADGRWVWWAACWNSNHLNFPVAVPPIFHSAVICLCTGAIPPSPLWGSYWDAPASERLPKTSQVPLSVNGSAKKTMKKSGFYIRIELRHAAKFHYLEPSGFRSAGDKNLKE